MGTWDVERAMGRESQLVGERKVGKGYTHSVHCSYSTVQSIQQQTVIYSTYQTKFSAMQRCDVQD